MGARVLHAGHQVGDGEEEADMLVRLEGASPMVVGSYYNRRLVAAGDRVDAGARSPLEIVLGRQLLFQ